MERLDCHALGTRQGMRCHAPVPVLPVLAPQVQDAITFIKDIAASLDIPISPKPMKHLHGPEAAH
eukprot:1159269-Pelagomonas_calceolata.AAC.11